MSQGARLLLKRPALKLAEFNYQHDWTGLDPLIAIQRLRARAAKWTQLVITIEATQRKACCSTLSYWRDW